MSTEYACTATLASTSWVISINRSRNRVTNAFISGAQSSLRNSVNVASSDDKRTAASRSFSNQPMYFKYLAQQDKSHQPIRDKQTCPVLVLEEVLRVLQHPFAKVAHDLCTDGREHVTKPVDQHAVENSFQTGVQRLHVLEENQHQTTSQDPRPPNKAPRSQT
jgi:hypothetical protein